MPSRKRTYVSDGDEEEEEDYSAPPPAKRQRRQTTSNNNDNSTTATSKTKAARTKTKTKKKTATNKSKTKSKTKSRTKKTVSKTKTKKKLNRNKSKNTKSTASDENDSNDSKTPETSESEEESSDESPEESNESSMSVSSVSSVSDEEYSDEIPKWSCNQIRGKINRLLANGDIKVTHFIKEIRVNSHSYQRFMKLKGTWNGTQNGTYWASIRYFKKQEKIARKKKEKLSKLSKKKRNKILKSHKKEKELKWKEWNNMLDLIKNFEKTHKDYNNKMETLPIYDDCNDIRKKINQFLRKGIAPSRSQFLKEIGNVQANSFNSFMKMGPLKLSGASNKTYYLAYHWFEKLRRAKGEKKSKKRLENEKNFRKGFERIHDDGHRWVRAGYVPVRKGDHIEIVPRF